MGNLYPFVVKGWIGLVVFVVWFPKKMQEQKLKCVVISSYGDAEGKEVRQLRKWLEQRFEVEVKHWGKFDEELLKDKNDTLKDVELVVVSGGSKWGVDERELRKRELEFYREDCVNRKIVVLGICLGFEILYDAFSNCKSLIHDLPAERKRSKDPLVLDMAFMWKGVDISGPLQFTNDFHVLYHEQAKMLEPTSFEEFHCEKGNRKIVSSFQHCDVHIFGVQGHPERSPEIGKQILDFLADCGKKKKI